MASAGIHLAFVINEEMCAARHVMHQSYGVLILTMLHVFANFHLIRKIANNIFELLHLRETFWHIIQLHSNRSMSTCGFIFVVVVIVVICLFAALFLRFLFNVKPPADKTNNQAETQ